MYVFGTGSGMAVPMDFQFVEMGGSRCSSTSRSQEDWAAVQASGSRDEKKEDDETAKEVSWPARIRVAKGCLKEMDR